MVKTLMNFKLIAPRSKSRVTINNSILQDAFVSGEKTQNVQRVSNGLNAEAGHETRNGDYRLGCLEVNPHKNISQSENSEVKTFRRPTSLYTPACIYYCQAANLIPHLLPEVASSLNDSAYQPLTSDIKSIDIPKEPIELEPKKIKLDTSSASQPCPKIHHTSLDHFVNVHGYKELPSSFSAFTSTEGDLTLMDVHDPSLRYQARAESIKPWKSGKEFANLATNNGLFKITPASYIDLISAFKMDMAVCLYDCMPNVATRCSKVGSANLAEVKIDIPNQKRVAKSVERTSKWTEACALSPSISGTSLLSAVIGGPYTEQRTQSAKLAMALGDKVSGYLVANLHGGEKEKLDQLQQTLEALRTKPFSSDKPVFSWEFTTPREVLLAVERGVDVFDSTYPYLAAEHGHALTFESIEDAHSQHPAMINLNRPTSNHVSEFQDDTDPISKQCSCYSCSNNFSKAYIVHLLNTHEMLANILLMCHNLQVYLDFFDSIRTSIHNGSFEANKNRFLEAYENVDWFAFLEAELTIPPSQRENKSTLD